MDITKIRFKFVKNFNMKKAIEIKKEVSVGHPTNKPLSEQEIWLEIKKAEDRLFCTVQEGMKDFEQWLQEREK